MHKKFIKFIRTSLAKTIKGKFVLFDLITRDSFRSRALLYKHQRPTLRKNRNLCRRKNKPLEKALDAVSKALDLSFDAYPSRYPKAVALWKAIVPQIFYGEKELKTPWTKFGNDVNTPKFTRAFTGKSSDREGPFAEKDLHYAENERFFEKPIERIIDRNDEQSFYTEEGTLKKPWPQTDSMDQTTQKEETVGDELPPPQRCRLSCPLPPKEFIPPDTREFLPKSQSPAVKFSSLPSEFLPPEPKTTPAESTFLQKSREQSRSKKRSASSSTKSTEWQQRSSKPNKNYLSLKRQKGFWQQPAPEIVPKMKALLFEPNSLELNFDAVNAPTKIFKDEVLVQVTFSGVCGTDLFITEGKVSCGDVPVILGHEISGKVYAAGSEVDHVRPGDNVAVNAYTACCVCRYCSWGLYSACINDGLNNSIGISKNGGWAEFVVVKKDQVYKIPSELGLDQAALIQPLSCVLSAMSRLNITHGMDVLILGLGLSGSLWASILHSKGLKNVFVSDRNEKRKEQFQLLNLNFTFIPPEDIGKYLMDVVVECTGSPTSIEKAFNILNPNGQMCFFGKPNPMTEVRCIPYEIVKKEITIVGNAGNAFCFSKAIDLAASMGHKYLDFEKLGVGVFELEDYRLAFQMKKSGEVGKIMFKFES